MGVIKNGPKSSCNIGILRKGDEKLWAASIGDDKWVDALKPQRSFQRPIVRPPMR